jgi:hypothetical protein
VHAITGHAVTLSRDPLSFPATRSIPPLAPDAFEALLAEGVEREKSQPGRGIVIDQTEERHSGVTP